MGHIAFKCAYNDNRADDMPVVGYMGACTRPTAAYNVKKGSPWCSLPECPCSAYVLKGEPRPEEPCQDSRILLEWKAYAGFDHDGPWSWTPRKINNADVGDLTFLTTRYPGAGEAERFIFAVFRIAEVVSYDPDKSGWVKADDELKLALSPDELVFFWDHYKNRGNPSYIGWGSGRFRYLDGEQAKSAMAAVAALVKDPKRKGIALELARLAKAGK